MIFQQIFAILQFLFRNFGKSPLMASHLPGAEAEKGPSYVALHTIGRQDDINPPEGAHEASFTFWMARFLWVFQIGWEPWKSHK